MTDKTLAMPSSLLLFEFWWEAHMPKATQAQAWSAWKAAQDDKGAALATLQAQPAEVSDAEIMRASEPFSELLRADMTGYQRIAFARAILALRPQAVPMTEDEFVACLTKANCIGVVKMSYDSGPYGITRPSINASKLKEAIEAHHGITQRADGGEVE